jgi:hypothetical protein
MFSIAMPRISILTTWLRGDPLRDASAATLQALAIRGGQPGSAALAQALFNEHNTRSGGGLY